jgi:hypothetical protein
MSVTNFFLQNIIELFTLSNSMNGGKLNIQKNKENFFLISLVAYLIILLLKGIIVYFLYNYLVPKLIYSLSENKSIEIIEHNFKNISFVESVLLVIFANTLFGC